MGRKRDFGRKAFPRPLMTYVSREQEARIKDAAEAFDKTGVDRNYGVAGWLRRLIVAELSRQAAREQLEQTT